MATRSLTHAFNLPNLKDANVRNWIEQLFDLRDAAKEQHQEIEFGIALSVLFSGEFARGLERRARDN